MKKNILLLISLFLIILSTTQVHAGWVKGQKGCLLWTVIKVKSIKWTGKCKDGYASGKGIAFIRMSTRKLDEYYGEMRKGKIYGYGKYKWSSKDVYEGEWKNNKLDGQGTYIWPDGSRYEGEWKNGKREGQGKITWKDPCPTCNRSFVGVFSNNTMVSGTITLGNGEKVHKKKRTLSEFTSDINSTYLNLMKGYMINQSLYNDNYPH